MITDTELRLSFWRDGSTKAERLAAAALRLAGYVEIDPQSPLGGPDGKKDIVCQKGTLTWVAAVYFPTGPKAFSAIKRKYLSDLKGMPEKHQGFVFVTNQTLTPKQKESLSKIAQNERKETDFLHLQQLVNLLDSAPGYGVRIQFLNIPMTIEEQLSWVVDSDGQTAQALTANTRELRALRASIERMNMKQSEIVRTLGLSTPGGGVSPDLISVSSFSKSDEFTAMSSNLSIELILLFHRLVCFEFPARFVGKLREQDVWLADGKGRKTDHAQPPPANEVQEELSNLCVTWNGNYQGLRTKNQKLDAVSVFHSRLLVIHPFVDGNGRVARAILMQHCLDLFGKADMSMLNKGVEYYSALKAADEGETEKLRTLLLPVVA